jgi:hypothetical protein
VMSAFGTSRHLAALRNLVAYWRKADSGKQSSQKIYGFAA